MELKLDTQHIFQLGESITKHLITAGIEQQADLTIHVTKEQLRKIDEDLFYRRDHDKKEEFIPSDNEIRINFDKVIIKIQSQENV